MRIYISFDTESVIKANGELRRDIVVFGRQFLIDAMKDDPEQYGHYDEVYFMKLCAALASGWVEFLETIQRELYLLDDKALDHGDSLAWCGAEFAPIFHRSLQTFLTRVEELECPVYDAHVMGLLVDRVEAEYRDMLAALEGELESVFERAWDMFRT